MTDYEDYENNLAFPPQGDWADTNPRANTDRTASTIELVNKIEGLNKWLDLKSEYIGKLEGENAKLKAVLKRCREFVDDFPTDNDERWAYKNAVSNGIDELLGEDE